MQAKTFTYKKNLFAYRLHDWKEPTNGAKMDDHMSKMLSEGWKIASQSNPSLDVIAVTYTKE